jgi:hypothetical protein
MSQTVPKGTAKKQTDPDLFLIQMFFWEDSLKRWLNGTGVSVCAITIT